MRNFEKFSRYLLISPWFFTMSSDKSNRKRNISKFFLEIFFVSSVTTISAIFSEFDRRNVILFQVKVFDRNIKEPTLSRCFIKVTARPSFMQLRVTRRINRVH